MSQEKTLGCGNPWRSQRTGEWGVVPPDALWFSFALWGLLIGFDFPMACAMGCILSPLRG
jgi:hypothetical protein